MSSNSAKAATKWVGRWSRRMNTIYILQLLCPNRHCLHRSVYQEGRGDFLMAIETAKIIGLVAEFCLICGSRESEWEERPTHFATLANLGAAMAGILEIQHMARDRWLGSGIPWKEWPKELHWNFDVLCSDRPMTHRL